jgi:uncharacterized damage-inducible protein DinB
MLLNLENVPAFYKTYVKQIDEGDLLQALRISGHRTQELIHSIHPDKADYRYAENKWTIREVLVHLMDAERIFAYRALRFARQDKTPLAGWDENNYAPHLNAFNRSLKKLADEMSHLRSTSIDLFESFTPEMLTRKGVANNNEMTVAVLGFVIAGHEIHHGKILKERYLTDKK